MLVFWDNVPSCLWTPYASPTNTNSWQHHSSTSSFIVRQHHSSSKKHISLCMLFHLFITLTSIMYTFGMHSPMNNTPCSWHRWSFVLHMIALIFALQHPRTQPASYMLCSKMRENHMHDNQHHANAALLQKALTLQLSATGNYWITSSKRKVPKLQLAEQQAWPKLGVLWVGHKMTFNSCTPPGQNNHTRHCLRRYLTLLKNLSMPMCGQAPCCW